MVTQFLSLEDRFKKRELYAGEPRRVVNSETFGIPRRRDGRLGGVTSATRPVAKEATSVIKADMADFKKKEWWLTTQDKRKCRKSLREMRKKGK